MDIFSGVVPQEDGGYQLSALVRDEDVELEFNGELGELICCVLNDDYTGSIDPEIKKYEKYYRTAEQKQEKARLFFCMDRLEKIKKSFQNLNSRYLRELADLVFLQRVNKTECPVSQRLFYYGYFLGDMRFPAQLALLGSLSAEPTIPEKPSREQLHELFEATCAAYRSPGRGETVEFSYRLNSIEDLIRCSLFEMARHEILIRKCGNCGRYFVPRNRSDTLYCEGNSPQDPTRTCRQYNSEHLWYDRLKSDGELKLCRNIASAKQMLAKRNPKNVGYAEDLKRFREESKQWKEDYLAGRKSREEFREWLEDSRGKKKAGRGA
jgi:hypothetical protein